MSKATSHAILPLFFLLAVTISQGCNTTRGGGELRANAIASEIDSVRAAIDSSSLPEAEKKRLNTSLSKVQDGVVGLGNDVDTNKRIADEYKEDSTTLHWIYAAFIMIGVLLIAYLMRGRITKFFTGGIA